MSRTVLLDATPLGLLSAPPRKAVAVACSRWLADLLRAGVRVIVPEITDYEVRRELQRASKTANLKRLDDLSLIAEYLLLSTVAMRRTADLWAQARQRGLPTAGDNTIDVDVILAAQALTLGTTNVIVASSNVGHLSRFVPADEWNNISP
jgi:predicted nucleic acid-binding protein